MPSFASLLAVARPIPLVPPVIRAVNELVDICESPFSSASCFANVFRGFPRSLRWISRQHLSKYPEGPGMGDILRHRSTTSKYSFRPGASEAGARERIFHVHFVARTDFAAKCARSNCLTPGVHSIFGSKTTAAEWILRFSA